MHLPEDKLKRLSFAKVLNFKFQQQPHWTLTHDPNTTLAHCYGWLWTHTNTDTLCAYTSTGGTSTCPGEHSLFFSDGYHKQTVLPSLSRNSHPLAQPGQMVLRHPWQMVLKCRGQQVHGYLLESPKTQSLVGLKWRFLSHCGDTERVTAEEHFIEVCVFVIWYVNMWL